MLNPDGYEFSRLHERLWRKNRRPPSNDGCFGVDLNRNYDVIGFGVGASNDSCSNTYLGPYPASEPEVRAATEVLMGNREKIRVSLSLHSFGKLLTTYQQLGKDYENKVKGDYRTKVADFLGIHNATRLG